MEQTLDQEPTIDTIKPRNEFVAFLLSLMFPGLGQIYNGQPNKAIFFFGLLLLSPFIFGVIRGATLFYGLLLLLCIEISLRIYIIYDGVKNANRQKEYVLKPYNTWYYYLLIAIGMMSVFIIYDVKKVVGIQNFQIPTTSSNPTILAGDRIIADIEAYKNNDPDYGDLVVFKKPDEQCYVFRIVGLPNDKIEIIDNIVSVNGKISKSNFIAESIDFGMKINELEEELPNGHKHLIYKFKTTYDTSKANIKNIIVPPNSYYVLGDYRDNAVDSRFDGFVPKDKIIGRVIYCYWRKIGPKKTNIDLRDK